MRGIVLLLKKFKKGEKDGVEKEMKERVCVLDVDVYPDIQEEEIGIYENI